MLAGCPVEDGLTKGGKKFSLSWISPAVLAGGLWGGLPSRLARLGSKGGCEDQPVE